MYYIGLDIHKKNTQACVKNENGKIISSARFLSDVDHISAFLDRLGTAEAKIVMEATGFYEFIYDAIEARGFEVLLAHPLKLRALTADGRRRTRTMLRCLHKHLTGKYPNEGKGSQTKLNFSANEPSHSRAAVISLLPSILIFLIDPWGICSTNVPSVSWSAPSSLAIVRYATPFLSTIPKATVAPRIVELANLLLLGACFMRRHILFFLCFRNRCIRRVPARPVV